MRNTNRRTEDGFTLLEMVVAVGIVLILSVVGTISYGAITSNARQSAVERSAGEVYTAAHTTDYAAGIDSTPEEVAQRYSDSIEDITVEAERTDDGICVSATHIRGETTEVGACETTNGGGDNTGEENWVYEQGTLLTIYTTPVHYGRTITIEVQDADTGATLSSRTETMTPTGIHHSNAATPRETELHPLKSLHIIIDIDGAPYPATLTIPADDNGWTGGAQSFTPEFILVSEPDTGNTYWQVRWKGNTTII